MTTNNGETMAIERLARMDFEMLLAPIQPQPLPTIDGHMGWVPGTRKTTLTVRMDLAVDEPSPTLDQLIDGARHGRLLTIHREGWSFHDCRVERLSMRVESGRLFVRARIAMENPAKL